MPGQTAVFTQSDSLMFDGSDTFRPGSVFVLFFTVNGTTVTVLDTSRELNTFGFDDGSSESCGLAGCNESLPWTQIATSTVAVERSTLALLGLGLAGIVLSGRRRWSRPLMAPG